MQRSIITMALSLIFFSISALAASPASQNNPSETFPYFASLKYSAVNGRKTPGERATIAWQYQRRDLPVYVLEPSGDWRRIRDPWGEETWVKRYMLETKRTAFVPDDTSAPIILRKGPAASTRGVARMAPGGVANLGACAGLWCKLTVGNRSGWTLRSAIWGDLSDDAVRRLSGRETDRRDLSGGSASLRLSESAPHDSKLP